MNFHKSNYLTRTNYILLYIIAIFWAWYSKNNIFIGENISFYLIFGFLLLYFFYISYKRLEYSELKNKLQKKVLIFLWLPFIFMFIGIILWIIFLFINIYLHIKINIPFDNINFYYVTFFVLLLWLLHFLAFIKIILVKIDKEKNVWKKVKKKLKSKEIIKWWYRKWRYLYIIFIIFVIYFMQITGNWMYGRYINDWNIEKLINFNKLWVNYELWRVLNLDIESFYGKEINRRGSEPTNEYVKLLIWNNFFINNNYIYNEKQRNRSFISKYKWDIYKLTIKKSEIDLGIGFLDFNGRNSVLDYMYECNKKDNCLLNTEKVKLNYYIGGDWEEIFLFYLILWFILFKTNLFSYLKSFKIFYYTLLPFKVLFLLIKKYIILFFPKIINFIKNIFWKLEIIEKDLKNKK